MSSEPNAINCQVGTYDVNIPLLYEMTMMIPRGSVSDSAGGEHGAPSRVSIASVEDCKFNQSSVISHR